MRTEELTLPGFRHDTFSSVYPAAAASPVFARMPLGPHGLEWVHPAACSAHPLPNAEAVVLSRDLATTARSLDAQNLGDGARWAAYATPFLDAFPAVRETMLSGFPPVTGPLHLLRDAGPARLAEFLRMLGGSAVGLGRRLFEGDGNRAWLYGAAMHGDTPPGRPGSGIAAFYLNLLGHGVGWPSPRGGAQALTDALVGYLESLGGQIRTHSPVDRVLCAHGRVSGVGVAGGDVFHAPIVVADVLPAALVRMTGDALAAWYRRALSFYRAGPATLKVDWALDGPIPWLNPDVAGAGTVHVAGTEQELLDGVRRGAVGLPERPVLLLGQQSVADPGRAPAGKHTAWAYTHGPVHLDWERLQDRHVEAMEAQV
ncbi:MAG: NAD(P)/FAD-dependent oxidoreductase, partial [Solirubrobacterales bacterium]|nr:NAD(P)/FAD-dependent oxidoreductase [Solirubrobacterales bacterium]